MALFSGPQGLFACYCLVSDKEGAKTRCYIGFANNPIRRIKQHNREIAGGAKRTSCFAPWRMVLFVGGFPTKIAALKFEYIWTYPTNSQYSNNVVGIANGVKLTRPRTIATALNVLSLLLTSPPYSLQPLYVVLLEPEAHVLRERLAQSGIPVYDASLATLRLEPGKHVIGDAIYALRRATDAGTAGSAPYLQSNTQGAHTTVATADLCPICQDSVSPSSVQCTQCTACFCITCAGKLLTTATALIPTAGRCPICKQVFTWRELLRNRADHLAQERATLAPAKSRKRGSAGATQQYMDVNDNTDADDDYYESYDVRLSSTSSQEQPLNPERTDKSDLSYDTTMISHISCAAVLPLQSEMCQSSPGASPPRAHSSLAPDALFGSPRLCNGSEVISITD